MPFNSTAGSASANSYTSLDFANNYLLLESIGYGDWETYSDADKEAGLIQATRQLDGMMFKGGRVTTTQALSFPRSGIYQRSGLAYATDAVPAPIQQATAELAYSIIQAGSESNGIDLASLKSFKQGDEQYEFREGMTQSGLPSSVSSLLRDFLLTTQARILRA